MPMATIGDAGSSELPANTNTAKRKRTRRTKTNPHHRFMSLLSSATSAAHSFLLQNDLRLLPSQSLAIESLLSSLPFPAPPPPASFLQRLLASSSSAVDFDPRWARFFRMSKPTFFHLLSLLSPTLFASLPASIPQDAALATTLFRLSHAASYKSLARLFSLDSPQAACLAFYTVCKAVNERLGELVEFRKDLERIVLGFGWISLPNCCGALGFGRFGIDTEELGVNRWLFVQALVDSEGRFLDISAGWPCTMKPFSVLTQTRFFSGVEKSKELLNGPCFELNNGSSIPQYVVGDSCLPLLPWLLTPYIGGDGSLGSAGREFNAAHSRAMGLVKTAFRSVKARWQLLARKWKTDCVELMPFVIVMGCLLHNFLIKCNEPPPSPEDALECFKEEEKEEGLPIFEGQMDETGRKFRDSLAQHLCRDQIPEIHINAVVSDMNFKGLAIYEHSGFLVSCIGHKM